VTCDCTIKCLVALGDFTVAKCFWQIDGHKEINGNIKEDAGTQEETETFLPSNLVSRVEQETSV